MKNIVIIGSGALGKQVVWLIEDINKVSPTYFILGFLDDDLAKNQTEFFGYKVLGSVDQLEEIDQKLPVSAVIAIQDGETRKKIVDVHPDFTRWESIVHPSSVISPTSPVGKGCIVFPQVTISVDTELGNFGIYYIHATVCNDCKIGDYVTILTGATVSDCSEVGDLCFLDSGCCLYPRVSIGNGVKVSIEATVDKDYESGAQVTEKRRFFFFG